MEIERIPSSPLLEKGVERARTRVRLRLMVKRLFVFAPSTAAPFLSAVPSYDGDTQIFEW